MDNELKLLIGKDEKIIYAGKPNKKCFIFESIFNPLLPFALIWGLFDFFFIGAAFSSDKANEATYFIVPVMLLRIRLSMRLVVFSASATIQNRLRNFRTWICIVAFLTSGLVWGMLSRRLPRQIL